MLRYHGKARWRWLVVAVALFIAAIGAYAQELRVATSGGSAAALETLGRAYQSRTGTKVTLIQGASMGQTPEAIPNRLARGEPIDVLVMVASALDDLDKAGKIEPDSKVVLARSLIAAAVKAGAPKPDIATVDGLRQALLNAKSVAYSDSASGVYLSTTLFSKLGIAEQMKGKARQIPGTPVGEVVARGDVELGFQQYSELKPIAGIDILGPIPESVQLVTLYSAAVVRGSSNAGAARAFIDFLSSPAAAEAIRDTGLQPLRDAPR